MCLYMRTFCPQVFGLKLLTSMNLSSSQSEPNVLHFLTPVMAGEGKKL